MVFGGTKALIEVDAGEGQYPGGSITDALFKRSTTQRDYIHRIQAKTARAAECRSSKEGRKNRGWGVYHTRLPGEKMEECGSDGNPCVT